jgi:2,4-dichlorophenol 6-monooxygenase
MVGPWDEWLIIWGYDIEQGEPKLTDDEAVSVVRNLVGDETIEVKIRSNAWWRSSLVCDALALSEAPLGR